MKSVKLYAIGAPLMLLPLLDVSLSQLPKYLAGPEFRQFMALIITEVIAGVANAGLLAAVGAAFGVDLTG